MKKQVSIRLMLLFTFSITFLFTMNADSATIGDRFKGKNWDREGKKGVSEEKSQKEVKRELEKEITKRRKSGEVIPWTVLNSYELRYENEVTPATAKERKGESVPRPERITLSINVTNQTNYPLTALLLYIRITDEKGSIVFEGDVSADVDLPAWESRRVRPVCIEATSKEASEAVGKVRTMLRERSIKTDAQVSKILWKNGKVTANLPQ